MQFETSANSVIRPSVGTDPRPAFAARPGAEQVARAEPIGETGAGNAGPGQAAEGDYGFADLLDVINPLQHIPIVASLYREITGDEIKAPARILGGFLYGGPLGFLASAANAIVEESSGRDLTDNALAMVFGEAADPTLTAAAGVADAPLESLAPESPAPESLAAPASAATTAGNIILGALPTPQSSGFRAPPPPALAAPTPEPQAAPATAAGTPLLTGEAALEALAADVRRGRAPAAPPLAAPPPAEQSAEAAPLQATSGVPANLIGLGSRDRRGLEPARTSLRMPLPTDRLPNRLPGAASAPTGQALVDAGLTPPPADSAASGVTPDISNQLLDALKKYEVMMQERKAKS